MLRATQPLLGRTLRNAAHRTVIRFNTTQSKPPVVEDPAKARLEKTLAKYPMLQKITKIPILGRYTMSMYKHPYSFVSSFLLLHELTAVIPLFILWYMFYQNDFVPFDLPSWALQKFTGVIERLVGDSINDFTAYQRTKLIITGATAYASVKAMYPARLVLSFIMAPSVSRWFILPVTNLVKRVFRKGPKN